MLRPSCARCVLGLVGGPLAPDVYRGWWVALLRPMCTGAGGRTLLKSAPSKPSFPWAPSKICMYTWRAT